MEWGGEGSALRTADVKSRGLRLSLNFPWRPVPWAGFLIPLSFSFLFWKGPGTVCIIITMMANHHRRSRNSFAWTLSPALCANRW